MPEVNNPTEQVGALVVTLAANAVQMKRGAGTLQTMLYWNDASGDVVVNAGPEATAAVWLVGKNGVVATFTGADGVYGYAHRWALASDSRYAHNLQATISADGQAAHNALVFNLNQGALTGSVPVLELRGGSQPTVIVRGGQNARLSMNDALVSQFAASLLVRGVATSSIEFGHANPGGYGSTIGYETSSGIPFLAFNASAGTNVNTYRTWGIPGIILKSNLVGGAFFYRATIATADNQVPVLTGGWSGTGQLLTDGLQGLYGIDVTTGSSQFSLLFVAGTGTLLQSFASLPLHLNRQGNAVWISGGSPFIVGTTDPGGSDPVRVAGGIYTNAYLKVAPGYAVGGIYTNGVQMMYMSALTGTGYTVINAPDGANSILLGNTGDPANYFNNTAHYFRNRATDVIYGIWTAAALQLNTQLYPRGLNSAAMISLNTAWEYLEVAVGATVNVCAFAYGMVEISEWQSYGDCALLFLHNGGIEIVFQNATNRFGTSAAFYYQLGMVGGYLTLKNNSPNLMRFGGMTRAHK